MKIKYIILKDGRPMPAPSVRCWAEWFERADRRLRYTQTPSAEVSTVFTGIDLNYRETGNPLLWETIVFGGPLNQQRERYSSAEEAIEGHSRWVIAANAQAEQSA